MELLGVKLVGVNSENLNKIALTVALLVIVAAIRWAAGAVTARLLYGRAHDQARFWTRQVISVLTAAAVLLGLVSIWIDQPARLTTALGLVTAGLAFALQRVITSLAGYVVILRGRNFSVGDRIVMGGVRGQVIALGFMQTTIMEMGQAPGEQGDDPSIWVKSRQPTGRIVTVTNDRIFEQPVYNYTREFPFIWEEITLPISYKDDYGRAERLLHDIVDRHTARLVEQSRAALEDMRRRYFEVDAETQPQVYYRLTDNWVELTVRFVCEADRVRAVKDAISRELLAALHDAGIAVASATFEVVGVPPLDLHVQRWPDESRRAVGQRT